MAAMLYDAQGKPIQRPKAPDPNRVAVASVRDRFYGYPSRGLTPDKLARILRDADDGDVAAAVELGMEMEEKDAHLASVLQTRKNAVIGLDRQVLAYSEDPADEAAAELCRTALSRLDVEDLILDLMDAVGKGFSAVELMWETGDKALPWGCIWVDPRRFTWLDDELRLLTDKEPTNGETLAPAKFMVQRYKARSGAPARAGMMRTVAWSYLFKNYSLKDWVTFAELYGMPLRLGKYDPEAGKEDKDALLAAVMGLASDAAGIISRNTEIEFVEAVRNSSVEVYEKLAEYCDRAISKAILGQTLTTDTTGSTGTRAAGQVHDQVRHDIIEADAKAVARTIQRDLFAPVVGFNLGWEQAARLPRIEFDVAVPEDLKAVAETYAVLVRDVGLRIGAAHIRERFNVPAPGDDEELVGTAATPPAPPVGTALKDTRPPAGTCPVHGVALADGAAGTAGVQDRVDGLADASRREGAASMAAMAEDLARLVSEATDFDDLRDRVLAAYGSLDPSGLQQVLARAMAMADLGGRASA